MAPIVCVYIIIILLLWRNAVPNFQLDLHLVS